MPRVDCNVINITAIDTEAADLVSLRPAPGTRPARQNIRASGEGPFAGAPRRWRGHLVIAAKLCLMAGLLYWLLASGRLQLDRLAQVDVSWRLSLLLLMPLTAIAVSAVRWWWLLRIQQLPQKLSTVMALTWSGCAASLLLPGSASGDLAKTYLIVRRSPQARARAFSTVLADRALGLYNFLCLGCLAVAWIWWSGAASSDILRTIAAPTSVMLAGLTACVIGLFWPPSRRLLLSVLPLPWQMAWEESFALYFSAKRQLLGCFALTTICSLMTIGPLALAGSVLGDPVAWDTGLAVGPLVVLVNSLPLTPGGIGLGESAASELFAEFGVHRGAEMMMLSRGFTALAALPGFLVLACFSSLLPRAEEAPVEALVGIE